MQSTSENYFRGVTTPNNSELALFQKIVDPWT
jgi:hypothetical protein